MLTAVSSLVYGRLRMAAVDDPSWLGVDALLEQPHLFRHLVRPAGRERFGSDDWGLVTAQVAREAISILVTAAVHTWATQRRLLDLSAANVMLREDPSDGVVVGLRRLDVVVAPADPLARLAGAVEVMDEAKMFQRLVDRALGAPLPIGMMPTGPADQVAAVAAIIATVRRTMRSGNRHLWGTAALALSSTLTQAGHTVGPRADRDRAALLTARPDLARTIELVTVPATDPPTPPDPGDGGIPADEITFALRRTCCLLVKLPGAAQCGTCSLRDRDTCVSLMTTWARASLSRK